MHPADNIEDRRDNPINRAPRPEPTRLDDIRDECARQQHPAPVARPNGPIARCMARHAARVNAEREMFAAEDSLFGVLS